MIPSACVRTLLRFTGPALLLAVLVGCAVFPVKPVFVEEVVQAQEPTPAVPLPTPDSTDFTPVYPQACNIAEWESLQTDRIQGDMLAWSPDSRSLAYIGRKKTGWYTGHLMLAGGEAFADRRALTDHVEVVGDLTMSGDGERLAFVALRPETQLYTVMVQELSGGPALDLFPGDAARTDGWSGTKAIERWVDSRHLLVVYSCGSGCDQRVEISITDGSQRPAGREGYKALETAASPVVNTRAYDKETYPQMFQPNWSPDGTRVVYFDRNGSPWVLNIPESEKYWLEVGVEDALESKWSPDGRYLAVRTDGRVFVFEMGCEPQMEEEE